MFITKLSLLAAILIAGVNSFPAQDIEVYANPEPKGTCYISQENGYLRINCVRSLNTEQIEHALESGDNVEEESQESPESRRICTVIHNGKMTTTSCKRSKRSLDQSENNVEEESPEARRICTVIYKGKMTTTSCKRSKRSVDQSENNVEEKSAESAEPKITCRALVEDGNLVVRCGQGLESGDNVEEESQESPESRRICTVIHNGKMTTTSCKRSKRSLDQSENNVEEESPEPRRICTVIHNGKMTTTSCKRSKRSLDDMSFEQNENDVPVCKVVDDFLLCQERDLSVDEKEVEGFFETVKNNLLV